jgi:hypothetical protein
MTAQVRIKTRQATPSRPGRGKVAPSPAPRWKIRGSNPRERIKESRQLPPGEDGFTKRCSRAVTISGVESRHADHNHLPLSGRLSEIDTGSDNIGDDRRYIGTTNRCSIVDSAATTNAFRPYVTSLAGANSGEQGVAGYLPVNRRRVMTARSCHSRGSARPDSDAIIISAGQP